MSVQPSSVRGFREPAFDRLKLIRVTKSAPGIAHPAFRYLGHRKWIARLATRIWVPAALVSIDILTITFGQETGTMKGTVEDFTEAAIPEASVALTHAADR